MRLDKEFNNVETSGQLQETSFSIKASSAAFEILSKRLYHDIPLAIIRELSTNALDAHTEAGIPKTPFQVVLPNVFAPQLKIRDFGKGLSHQDILQVYSTYFESARAESNAYTGCLGLGSKVPFSYTSSFSVTSYQSGEARIYAMYKGEDGTPKLSLISTGKTDEPDGLCIDIPINNKDIQSFVTAATFVYTYFDPVPTISGQTIDLHKEKIILQGANWIIRESGKLIAIMGNVAYPISTSELGIDYRINNAELFFNIGELDITASRESLHYSDRTKQTLIRRLNEIRDTYSQSIRERVGKAQNIVEATTIGRQIFTERYNSGKSNLPIADIFWRGHKIISNGYLQKAHLQISGTTVRTYYLQRHTRVWSSEYENDEDLDQIETFFYNDLSLTVGRSIVANYVKESSIPHCKVLMYQGSTKELVLPQLETLGIPKDKTVLTSSLLEQFKKNRKVSAPAKKNFIRAWNFKYARYGNRSFRECWGSTDLDLSTPRPYVFIEKGNIYLRPDQVISNSTISEIIRFIPGIQTIVGISLKYKDKFLKLATGWESLDSILKKRVQEVSSITSEREVLIRETFRGYVMGCLTPINLANINFAPLKEVLTILKATDNNPSKTILIPDTIRLITGTSDQKEQLNVGEDIKKIIYDRYPLFNYVSSYSVDGTEKSKALLEYIEAIDMKIAAETNKKEEKS